jgi:hypothetical protein
MNDAAFPYDVFLSHSAKDKAVVRPLAERLRKDGLKVWFDEWIPSPAGAGEGGRRPGEGRGAKAHSIPAKIKEGLEHSRVLVLCMSANAFGSDWAQLEAGTFRFRDPLKQERHFLPRRLDDAPIKVSLAQFLYINRRTTDREQVTTHRSPGPPRREARRRRAEPFRDSDGHLRPAHGVLQR